jgi:ribonuclease HII
MIGIDEVGRGCLAGPLVVAAVRLKKEIPGLKDSKLLSKNQREALIPAIKERADIGLVFIEPKEIDTYGLGPCLYKAFTGAYKLIALENDAVIIDGNINYLKQLPAANATSQIKADSLYPEVSAASIYAKVTRDNYMVELAAEYPGYGFDKHVGYGTKSHIEALEKYGPIAGVHRFSYAPIKKFLV